MKTREQIRKRILKFIREVDQIIIDTNYFNGLPQAQGCPLDCETDRVALMHARKALAAFDAGHEWWPEFERAVKVLQTAAGD